MTEGFKTLLEIIKAGAVNNIELRNIMFPDYQSYVQKHGIDNEKVFVSYLEELGEEQVIESYKTFIAQKDACISALYNDLDFAYRMFGYQETNTLVSNKLLSLLKETKFNTKPIESSENKPSLKELAKELLPGSLDETLESIPVDKPYNELAPSYTKFDVEMSLQYLKDTLGANNVDATGKVSDEDELLNVVDTNAQSKPIYTETFFDDSIKSSKDNVDLRAQFFEDLKSICPRIPQLTYKNGYEYCYENVLFLANSYFKVELTQKKLNEFANEVNKSINILDVNANVVKPEYKDGFKECIYDVNVIVKKYERLLTET